MPYLKRLLEPQITSILALGKSILLLGPRQTGKTTLIKQLTYDLYITLANPRERLRYEKNPAILTDEVEALATDQKRPLIIIDEIQKTPLLLDAIQDLIDRQIAQFIVTGSSARKLRHQHNVNLLPGRVIPLRLDPLTYKELQTLAPDINTLLLYGSLPEIILAKNERDQLLDAYVNIYLEEEIRSEAIVRNLGHFARFLELAAAESGKVVNFSKIAQAIGVTHVTVSGYYQILEDCLIAERIEPITRSKTRSKLTKAQKYLFYDLGVRRLAAREGIQLKAEDCGYLFEQYIGLELLRMLRINQHRHALKFWRDANGPEVDWVIEVEKKFIPIEVKWTETPDLGDAKHLLAFLEEYQPDGVGYILCRTPRIMKLAPTIFALPWNEDWYEFMMSQ